MYTLEQLMALNDEELGKAAKRTFSMQLDPFSKLGKRAMLRRLEDLNYVTNSRRISPALSTIIGEPSLVIENILNYQDALLQRSVRSA